MPMMNFRLAEPAHLIDINFIDGLDYVRSENSALNIKSRRRDRALDAGALSAIRHGASDALFDGWRPVNAPAWCRLVVASSRLR